MAQYRLLLPTEPVRLGSTGLARHLTIAKGITLVREDGYWKTTSEPVDFSAYDRVFLGGYEHILDAADAAELALAGYGTYLTEIIVPIVRSGYGVGVYGRSIYGKRASGDIGVPMNPGISQADMNLMYSILDGIKAAIKELRDGQTVQAIAIQELRTNIAKGVGPGTVTNAPPASTGPAVLTGYGSSPFGQ